MEIGERVQSIAIENGATLAGIASLGTLKKSASHSIYNKMVDDAEVEIVKDEDLPDNEFISDDESLQTGQIFTWPDAVKSVLVIGLSHPEDKPELDWWDGRGTLGNRILIDIIKRTSNQIEKKLKVKTRKLHYYVEKGGIFLKDAAVLAGLGCIGKNNLLITPSYGPRIRLRALFLEVELVQTGPIAFDPCTCCKVSCRRVCPENAMKDIPSILKSIEFPTQLPGRDGMYSRVLCNKRMVKDATEGSKCNSGKQPMTKFCRKCESICPAGKR